MLTKEESEILLGLLIKMSTGATVQVGVAHQLEIIYQYEANPSYEWKFMPYDFQYNTVESLENTTNELTAKGWELVEVYSIKKEPYLSGYYSFRKVRVSEEKEESA